jgi:hypothetical protein
MTDKWNDDELHRAFGAWRDEAARDVPSFDATIAAARARRAVTPRRVSGVALWRAAAALLLIAGTGWFVRRPADFDRGPTVTVAAWRSPTAFLLDGARDPLLAATPTFSNTLLESGAHGARISTGSRP